MFLEGLPTDVSRLLIALKKINLDIMAQKTDDILSMRDHHQVDHQRTNLQVQVNAHCDQRLPPSTSNIASSIILHVVNLDQGDLISHRATMLIIPVVPCFSTIVVMVNKRIQAILHVRGTDLQMKVDYVRQW